MFENKPELRLVGPELSLLENKLELWLLDDTPPELWLAENTLELRELVNLALVLGRAKPVFSSSNFLSFFISGTDFFSVVRESATDTPFAAFAFSQLTTSLNFSCNKRGEDQSFYK